MNLRLVGARSQGSLLIDYAYKRKQYASRLWAKADS